MSDMERIELNDSMILEGNLRMIIHLLESLPFRMADEIEKREDLKKQMEIKRINSELDFLHNNQRELNKMMFGVDISQ